MAIADFGAGVQAVLRQRMLDQIAAQEREEKVRQFTEELSQRGRGHDLDERRLNLEEQRLNAPAPEPAPMVVGGRLVTRTGDVLFEPPAEPENPPTPKGPFVVGGNLIDERGGVLYTGPREAPAANTDAGWRLQTVTDPNTNQTRMVRVNERTGAVEPVELPGGMQPGGQRAPRLTAGQQDDLATMKTVEDMAKQAQALGDQTKWAGTGGLGVGSVKQFFSKNLGVGSESSVELRNKVGNIQATIAKLRGGTSFTPNEQKLLETYTPTINDSDLEIRTKLKELINFIALKRQNTMQFAGAEPTAATQPTAPPSGANNGPTAADLIQKYGGRGRGR